MSCSCCEDPGEEVVFHKRYLPWSVWEDACSNYRYYSEHPIIQREYEMGKEYVNTILPKELQDYVRMDLRNWPDADSPPDTVILKFYLKVI